MEDSSCLDKSRSSTFEELERLTDSECDTTEFDSYNFASSDNEDEDSICYARHGSRTAQARKRERLNIKKETAELKLEINSLDLTIHQLTQILAEKDEALREKMASLEGWLPATHGDGGVKKQGEHVKSELSEQIQQLHTEKKSLEHDIKELQGLFLEVDRKSTDYDILEAGCEVSMST